MTGHGGQRSLGELLRVLDRIDRDHLMCDYAGPGYHERSRRIWLMPE
jgi:hypothetical protein